MLTRRCHGAVAKENSLKSKAVFESKATQKWLCNCEVIGIMARISCFNLFCTLYFRAPNVSYRWISVRKALIASDTVRQTVSVRIDGILFPTQSLITRLNFQWLHVTQYRLHSKVTVPLVINYYTLSSDANLGCLWYLSQAEIAKCVAVTY